MCPTYELWLYIYIRIIYVKMMFQATQQSHEYFLLPHSVIRRIVFFFPEQQGCTLLHLEYIYITESLIDLTRAKGIAGNGCHGHVHLSFESQAFEPVEAS